MSEKSSSMRDAFGQALLDLAPRVPEMVVLDADVSSSTKTLSFGTRYPGRFFNVGVAEANMVDIAAGLATCGLRPVVSTFAIFISLKCAEQVQGTLCYNNLPVVLAGGYAGLSDSFDGASHQSITDISVMRSMPGLTVVVPADATEAAQALEQSLKRPGPTYIRLGRNPTPSLFENAEPLKIGRIRTITPGRDITLAVCGIPTFIAVQAADTLKRQGLSAELLEVSTIKPLDVETLVRSVSKTGRIVTVEEHSVCGGLGSAVAEALGETHPVRMGFVGIQDTFAESGAYMDLLEKYGIGVESIVGKAKALLQQDIP